MQETQLFDKEVNKMGEDQFFNMMLFPFLRSMYRIKDSVYIYRYGGGTFGYNKNFPQLFVSSDKRLKLLDHFNYTQGYGPLFDEYMDCFYHQAAQMSYYKKAGKEEIIDYFSNEIEQRELVPRLEDYYSRQESISKEVGLLMNRDFEGMYQYAYRHAQKFYGSLKYRVFSSVVKMLDSMN